MNRSPVLRFPEPEIRSFSVDPAYSDLHASTANIAWWVKAYGLSSKPEEPS